VGVDKGLKRLRILVAGTVEVPPPYGGMAKRVFLHAREWLKEGNEIYFLALAKKPNEDTLGVPVNLIYEYPSERSLSLAFWALKQFFKNPLLFARSVIKLVSVKLYEIKRLIYYSSYAVRLNQVLSELKPDVVNIQNAFGKGFIATWLCKGWNFPVALTSYAEMLFWKEAEEEADRAIRYKEMFEYVAKNIDHIISPSEHCAKGPLSYVSADKITVVYSGIDVESYDDCLKVSKAGAKKQLGLADSEIVLFIGGLFHWRKGPIYMAKAALQIVSEIPTAKIVFIGRGQEIKTEIENITKDIRQNILFTDSVSEERLSLFIRAANVLVFPSLTHRECMGMSMKEAMLLETPVVAFAVGGTPEAVIDAETGFLVPVEDCDMLAQRIVEILRDSELANRLGGNGRRKALAMFDSRITGSKSAEVFQRLAKEVKI